MGKDPYVIEIDRKRNCYSCKRFGHLTRNCRNQGIVGQERDIRYENNLNIINNLKEEENLVVLD